jgi:uncharacterized protein (DUF488 family)
LIQSSDTLWTIGHSSRPISGFIELLRAHAIQVVADVRRYPGSRKYPHFNAEALNESLRAAAIGYLSFVELGGRRKARPDSPHTVWRHAAFRGYADYMDTIEFSEALDRLIHAALTQRVAIMCSEALWWQCHRSMISDALKARGKQVLHIMAVDNAPEHPYTSAAQIIDGRLHYGTSDRQGSLPI